MSAPSPLQSLTWCATVATALIMVSVLCSPASRLRKQYHLPSSLGYKERLASCTHLSQALGHARQKASCLKTLPAVGRGGRQILPRQFGLVTYTHVQDALQTTSRRPLRHEVASPCEFKGSETVLRSLNACSPCEAPPLGLAEAHLQLVQHASGVHQGHDCGLHRHLRPQVSAHQARDAQTGLLQCPSWDTTAAEHTTCNTVRGAERTSGRHRRRGPLAPAPQPPR